MKLIGFCGLAGSGKSTAIDAVKDLGIVMNMGDVVRDELLRRDIELNDKNLGKIAKELRDKYGPEVIAKRCMEEIKTMNIDTIFVDGLRSMDEVKYFRKQQKFPVIAIIISDKKRFRIIKERSREDDPKTIEDLNLRDKREQNFGINEVIKNANYTIENKSTKSDLKKKTKELCIKIINNY
ncbi:MAG: AAA family ATPase [Candidatus Lokiarchaeota archaeon]|nr:AAA family ATPase [Candidatus Lokiarchaeota archaeon]MBD3198799.1 AAA family ATPase [Candidatus Lokiarchaeota archaeon]